jgi:hypothetical protein
MDKWLAVVIIAVTLMTGLYKITELSFDRLERLQKQSQVIVEK